MLLLPLGEVPEGKLFITMSFHFKCVLCTERQSIHNQKVWHPNLIRSQSCVYDILTKYIHRGHDIPALSCTSYHYKNPGKSKLITKELNTLQAWELCMYIYYVVRSIYIHYTYSHKHMYKYLHTCVRTYVHTYIHTHIHTYIHTHTHTYIHTYVHTWSDSKVMRLVPKRFYFIYSSTKMWSPSKYIPCACTHLFQRGCHSL